MIKTFEQFIAEKYCKSVESPINEAFQSSKLREIIKQHGKPKWSWDNKMLFDIKDNEIVDVLDSRDEYFEKYSNSPESHSNKEEATFILELEDGACVVISNLGVLKSYYNSGLENKMKEVLKKRHAERHVGNLGKGGELDIRKKHRENIDKLLTKRLAEKLQPNIKEIADAVQSVIDDIDTSDMPDRDDTVTFERDIHIGDDVYVLVVYYSYSYSDETYRKYGAEYCDMSHGLSSFTITDEEGTEISDEDLDIPSDINKELFKENTVEDIECGVYDYYSYYGVSRSDFY